MPSSSFFEKLKKGMNLEEELTTTAETTEIETKPDEDEPILEVEAIEETVPTAEPKVKQKVKRTPKKPTKKTTPEEITSADFKIAKIPSSTENTSDTKPATKKLKIEKPSILKPEEEGELVVDIYHAKDNLVIEAAIAGVKLEDLDIIIENEVITIKGDRKKQLVENREYIIQECFWGKFSRQIILPVEVDASRSKASFKEGILSISLPKITREKKLQINISS